MDDHGSPLFRVVLEDPLPKTEEVGGILGHSMVRPYQEVELPHLAHRHLHTTLTSKLEGGKGGKGGEGEREREGRGGGRGEGGEGGEGGERINMTVKSCM